LKPGEIGSAVIAVVDDDQPFRDALASVLRAAGFGVIVYGSAEHYLQSFGRPATNCLLLDVRLPGMSGVELQRHLLDSGDAAPIIFITGHGDESLRELLIRAGAKGFLSKPVRSDQLIAEIRSAISRDAEDSLHLP
jgi:two-component system, LuxR family, response regulator FixJ